VKGRRAEGAIRKFILPTLPGFGAKGKLGYAEDMNYVLRGFHLETSDFDESKIAIDVFVMPLWVPSDTLDLTYGGRLGALGGGAEEWWCVSGHHEEQAFAQVAKMLREEAWAFWEAFGSPASWGTSASNRFGKSLRLSEIQAYASVLGQDRGNWVDRVRSVITAASDPGAPSWAEEIRNRANRLLSLATNCGGVEKQIDEWRKSTLRAIKLL
jgi:hypothetical protein